MTTLLSAEWLDAEAVDGYKCTECDWFEQDEPESPLYECSNDGERFDRDNSADGGSNRCPQCNKFAAKVADYACPECGGEVEQVQAYVCPACEALLTEEQAADDETCPHCSHDFSVDPDNPEPEGVEEAEEEAPAPSEPPADAADLDKALAAHARLRPVVTFEQQPIDGPSRKQQFVNYDLLKWIADDAILADRNRKLDPWYIGKLRRDRLFPVTMVMPHRDGAEYRLFIALDPDSEFPVAVDVTPETYSALPEVLVPARDEP